MTLYDKRCLTAESEHIAAQMLIPHDVKSSGEKLSFAKASLDRCIELNPNVKTSEIDEIPFDDIKNGKYTVVCACDQSQEMEAKLAAACRASTKNVPFLTCMTTGWFGMSVLDAGAKYTCQVKTTTQESADSKRDEEADEEKFTEQSFSYPEFSKVWEAIHSSAFKKLKRRELKNLNQAIIACCLKYKNEPITQSACEKMAAQLVDSSDFYTGKNTEFHDLDEVEVLANGQFSPVCAIVGGFCAQEVIRLASKKEQPFDNVFLFDGKHYKGDIVKVAP